MKLEILHRLPKLRNRNIRSDFHFSHHSIYNSGVAILSPTSRHYLYCIHSNLFLTFFILYTQQRVVLKVSLAQPIGSYVA